MEEENLKINNKEMVCTNQEEITILDKLKKEKKKVCKKNKNVKTSNSDKSVCKNSPKKFKKNSNIQFKKSHNELIKYLENIDTSVLDSYGVEIILNEIKGKETELAVSFGPSKKLSECIENGELSHCMEMFERLDVSKVLFKNLGSKLYESILDRIFFFLYKNKENEKHDIFDKDQVLDKIESVFKYKYADMLLDENACFVLRKLFSLYTGKWIDMNSKYKKGVEFKVFKHPDVKYIKQIKYEMNFVKLNEIEKNHMFITLTYFLKFTKSQSFIRKFIDFLNEHMSENIFEEKEFIEFFKGKDVLLEEILLLSNEENNKKFSEIFIKEGLIDLMLKIHGEEHTVDFFMQTYFKKSSLFFEIDENIVNGELNENLRMAYFIHCLRHDKGDIVENFLQKKGIVSVFSHFVIKNDSLNTKYIDFICEIWNRTCEYDICNGEEIAKEFIKKFHKKWVNTKAGKTLLESFVCGNFDNNIKSSFFDHNVHIFSKIEKWNTFDKFIRNVLNVTSGHTKKRFGEILRKVNQKN
ncbi:hypothetical protein EHP00_796 [Ecytonucleospora hepatopenaei]|uniref:Uncharacterized protein n=1 Tax=Ecytonucleospora hepatopenaei TaxID=646526 RepID=A0A1W0E7U4_9MICR|nr:hypothetical protein EHP00_796 [Ecytonucleospora hepatopenaei]